MEDIFKQIMTSLQNEGRGQVKLDEAKLLELEAYFKNYQENLKNLPQYLCILAHDQGFHPKFAPYLRQILRDKNLDHSILVEALGAFIRHEINANQRLGVRISEESLEVLKSCLTHPHAEVVEWTLRAIDELGNQAVYFLATMKKIRPSKMGVIFNPHKRNAQEIIDLLINRWMKHERI